MRTFIEIIYEDIEKLCKKYGITHREKTDPSHCVCSIGYSPKNKKWYGWSHRAVHGFGIGDKLFDANWKPSEGATEEEIDKISFIKRGEKTIKNIEQAKQAATNFAEYVS